MNFYASATTRVRPNVVANHDLHCRHTSLDILFCFCDYTLYAIKRRRQFSGNPHFLWNVTHSIKRTNIHFIGAVFPYDVLRGNIMIFVVVAIIYLCYIVSKRTLFTRTESYEKVSCRKTYATAGSRET